MPDPDPWRCADCDTHYPVPSLARDCEARHAQQQEVVPGE